MLRRIGKFFENGRAMCIAEREIPFEIPYKYSFLKISKLSSGGRTGEYSKPHAPE